MSQPSRASIVSAYVIPLLAWAVAVVANWSTSLLYGLTGDSDSASYIECARSLAQGRGFQITRAFDGLDPGMYEPIRLWPPGYPVLIAGLVKLGLDATTAGLAVAALGAGAFVVLFSHVCRVRLGPLLGIMLASAIAVSRPLVLMCTSCLSDGVYLFFAAIALLMLGHSSQARRPVLWCLGAGFMTGMGWVTRNAGVAAGAAAFLYFAGAFFAIPFRHVLMRGLAWSSGFFAAATWLIVRNVRTFGKINPYSMPPSERGLVANTTDAVCAIVSDLAGTTRLSDGLIAASAAGVAAVIIAMAGWKARAILMQRGWWARHLTDVVLVLYAAVYMAVVVVSRSVYRWGEFVGPRHTIQIEWILLLLCGSAALYFAGTSRARRGAVAASAGLLLTVQGVAQVRAILARAADESRIVTPEQAKRIASDLGSGEVVLTDSQSSLRQFAGVPARAIPSSADGEKPLTLSDIEFAAEDGRLWGIVLANPEEVTPEMGDAMLQIVQRPESVAGFEVVEGFEDMVVLKWVGKPK